MTRNISDAPIVTIIAAMTVTHWRIPHFHLIHRMMVKSRKSSYLYSACTASSSSRHDTFLPVDARNAAPVAHDPRPGPGQVSLQTRARAAPQELEPHELQRNEHAPARVRTLLLGFLRARLARAPPRHCARVHAGLRDRRVARTRRVPVARQWRLFPPDSSQVFRCTSRPCYAPTPAISM